MHPKTEEFLYFLLWASDLLMRPTFRRLTDSYESWAYRNGLWRQLAELERRQLVESNPTQPNERMYRLTAKGRLHSLGGRDPQARWSRPWDGRWRLVLFDIPVARNTQRERLRRYLRDKGFGGLQKSGWITPDSLEPERHILADEGLGVQSLLLLEGWPCGGESDAEIVANSWDWQRINDRYAQHLRTLEERPRGPLGLAGRAKALQLWAARERQTWLEAVKGDPLLPEKLLPSGYLGQRAWQQRVRVLEHAGRLLRNFKP